MTADTVPDLLSRIERRQAARRQCRRRRAREGLAAEWSFSVGYFRVSCVPPPEQPQHKRQQQAAGQRLAALSHGPLLRARRAAGDGIEQRDQHRRHDDGVDDPEKCKHGGRRAERYYYGWPFDTIGT